MASRVPLLFLVICFSCYSGHASSFIQVLCDKTQTGQVNHQSVLTCEVGTSQEIPDLTITLVVWKKKGDEQFLSALDKRPDKENKFQPGFEVTLNNRTVSLVITDTKVKDEGEYSCQVTTDSGMDRATTNLKVTAKYDPPTVNISDEKDIPNVHKSLLCKASGGYPIGELRWFDETKTEWTKSAKKTENQMENGLYELSSKLLLMKGSTFSEYTCMVYNASRGKEGSAYIRIDPIDMDKSKQDPSKTSAIIAPVLVVGSLIAGLLMALLFFRRRSQKKIRRASTAPLIGTHNVIPGSDGNSDPPPPYCDENKGSMV